MMYKYTIQNGDTAIEFIDRPSAEQYAIENGRSLDDIKQIEYDTGSLAPIEAFEQRIAEGFPFSTSASMAEYGVSASLGVYPDDIANFSAMVVMVNEGLQLGFMTMDSDVVIKSQNDQIIHLTVGEFKQAIFVYGIYYKQVWDDYQSARFGKL